MANWAYLVLGQLRFDGGPSLALSSIRQKVHNDCALRDGIINLEKICAGYPTILFSLFPRSAIFPDTDYDVEAIVPEIEALSVTL
jgi:hypothetical protein